MGKTFRMALLAGELFLDLFLDPLSLSLAIPSSGAQAAISRKNFLLARSFGWLLEQQAKGYSYVLYSAEVASQNKVLANHVTSDPGLL